MDVPQENPRACPQAHFQPVSAYSGGQFSVQHTSIAAPESVNTEEIAALLQGVERMTVDFCPLTLGNSSILRRRRGTQG